MRYRYVTVLLLSLLTYSPVSAQVFDAPQTQRVTKYMSSLYAEFGGTNSVGSLNYDLMLDRNTVFRVGVSPSLLFAFHEEEKDDRFGKESVDKMNFTGVVTAGKVFGHSHHVIETGVGYVFGETDNPPPSGFPKPGGLVLNAGYRYVSSSENGVSFRAMFTPIFNSEGVSPWFGVSLGYSFSRLR